jgi:hypothetical protein
MNSQKIFGAFSVGVVMGVVYYGLTNHKLLPTPLNIGVEIVYHCTNLSTDCTATALTSLKLTPSSSLLVLHESGHSGPVVIDAGDVAAAILLQQLQGRFFSHCCYTAVFLMGSVCVGELHP